jgi:uncharacterized protein YndB with AHSA1/START domain
MSNASTPPSASGAVVHAVFHIERSFAAAPRRVFQAFSDPAAKAMWFAGTPEKWQLLERVMDFRVGGRELLRGKWADGPQTTFDAVYHDIIPEQRILYSYNMFVDARKLSVSLATIEIRPAAGGGTHLKVSEQGAFLDGYDDAGSRERGTGELLDALGLALRA